MCYGVPVAKDLLKQKTEFVLMKNELESLKEKGSKSSQLESSLKIEYE